MTTRQESERRHRDEHTGQDHVVAQRTPAQQRHIGALVDGKARSGHEEEARSGLSRRGVPVAEGPSVMSGEGHHQRRQPGGDVGQNRVEAPLTDQPNHARPVCRGGGRSDDDKTTDPAGRRRAQRLGGEGGRLIGVHEPAQHSAARVLCICADDFGLRDGVNEAILALLDAARVQAVSCMVGGKAWPRGAAELRQRDRQSFEAGLHLDLTDSPLLPGSRRRLSYLIFASMAQLIHRQALRREIDAQLDAFELGLGRVPAYVDGHQHVHQLPVVRGELLDALRKRYGPAQPWIRSTLAIQGAAWTPPKALWIERLGGRGLMAMADRQGLRHNRRLLGVYDFRGGETRYRALLGEWLQAARDGDLLMCHPCIGADSGDGIAAARQNEFNVLSGPSFASMLKTERLALQPLGRWLDRRDQLSPLGHAVHAATSSTSVPTRHLRLH